MCEKSKDQNPIIFEISSCESNRGTAPSPLDIFNQNLTMNQEGDDED